MHPVGSPFSPVRRALRGYPGEFALCASPTPEITPLIWPFVRAGPVFGSPGIFASVHGDGARRRRGALCDKIFRRICGVACAPQPCCGGRGHAWWWTGQGTEPGGRCTVTGPGCRAGRARGSRSPLRRPVHGRRVNGDFGPGPAGDLGGAPGRGQGDAFLLHVCHNPLIEVFGGALGHQPERHCVGWVGYRGEARCRRAAANLTARWWYSPIRGSSRSSPRRPATAYGSSENSVPPCRVRQSRASATASCGPATSAPASPPRPWRRRRTPVGNAQMVSSGWSNHGWDSHRRAPSKWMAAPRARAASVISISCGQVGRRYPASRRGSSSSNAPRRPGSSRRLSAVGNSRALAEHLESQPVEEAWSVHSWCSKWKEPAGPRASNPADHTTPSTSPAAPSPRSGTSRRQACREGCATRFSNSATGPPSP